MGKKGKKFRKIGIFFMVIGLLFFIIRFNFSWNFEFFSVVIDKDLWSLIFIAGTILFSVSYILFSLGANAYTSVKIAAYSPFWQSFTDEKKWKEKLDMIRKELSTEVDNYYKESVECIEKERNFANKMLKITIWEEYAKKMAEAYKNEDSDSIYKNLKKIHSEIIKTWFLMT